MRGFDPNKIIRHSNDFNKVILNTRLNSDCYEYLACEAEPSLHNVNISSAVYIQKIGSYIAEVE